ncbi:methyl-accepting chemotaxis protein [Endothiovibrio diazotrophicus]
MGFLKNLTLLQKFLLAGGLLVLTILGEMTLSVVRIGQVAESSQRVESSAIPILNRSHELKLAVVQVQQWLTDISATRGQDGLNDGFDEAAANAKRFHTLIDELKQLDPANRPRYEQMVPVFERYYQVGREMAEAYIAGGPAQGNQLMGRFDDAASALAKEVEQFVEAVHRTTDADLTRQHQATSALRDGLIGASVLMVLILALNVMVIRNALSPIPRIAAGLNRIAGGDLTGADVTTRCRDEIGMLADDLNAMKHNLREIIQRVASSSEQVVSATSQLATVTDQVRAGAGNQLNDVERIVGAMEEMGSTVTEVSHNADSAADAAHQADEAAAGGKQAMARVTGSIRNLAADVERAAEVINTLDQESENIGNILDVIRAIADQTNLLALNAAIEAARAGEQGRGFAVVADEVRTLASRTQKSTEEIQEMIQRLQSGARNAVEVMGEGRGQAERSVGEVNEADGQLGAITEAVSSITAMNRQIANLSSGQRTAADAMSEHVASIRRAAQESAGGIGQVADSSHELQRLAGELRTLASRFAL